MDKLKKSVYGIVNRTADETLLHNNANKASERLPVMRDLVAGEMCKALSLADILPEHIAAAHIAGDIHYHDLDYAPLFPAYNCMLIDVKGMFTKGFKMGNAEIEEPRSVNTACSLIAQIIAQVASHIYGGNTINRIDELLDPYVRISYKKLYAKYMARISNAEKAAIWAREDVEKEVYDAMQSLEYEINTLHTANGQTPFTTLGFGLGTSWEARMVQKAILAVRIKGLGKNGRTAIFPKLVFTIKDGTNHKQGDVNYDIKQLALECASKRMYPDILNYERLVEATGGFKSPMGCRSFLDDSDDGAYGIDGRNNLGVVSVNLPRLGLKSATLEEFWYNLDDCLSVAFDALMSRIDALRGVKAEVAPILYMEGACGVRLKAQDEVLQIFENGRSTISLGYIGVHEMCNALFPNEEHIYESVTKQDFAKAVVERLSEMTKFWKAETGWGFSLYGTPSESLCDRFCRLDKEVYGIVEGVTDHDYYTNSFHLDVEKQVTPYDKIDFEKDYPKLSSGGFICYGEFPNMQHNLQALEDVWDYAYKHIPYYGTNTPIDTCYECGFAGEFDCKSKGFTCPNCGNHNPETIQVTRRVCGYLGSPEARPFIEGKQTEVSKRVKHL